MGQSHKKDSVTVKIAVWGSGGVGKQALIRRWTENGFLRKYDPLIEEVFPKEIQAHPQPLLVEVLKTSGTEQFTSMRDLGIKQSAGHIVCFSLVSSSTLEALPELLAQIVKVKDVAASSIPLIIVGLKTDIHKDKRWEASTSEAQKLANKFGAAFFTLSNKSDPWSTIDECFKEIVWRVLYSQEQIGTSFSSELVYRDQLLKSFQTPKQHIQCCLFWFWYANKYPTPIKKKKAKKPIATLSNDTVYQICRVGMLLAAECPAPTKEILEIT